MAERKADWRIMGPGIFMLVLGTVYDAPSLQLFGTIAMIIGFRGREVKKKSTIVREKVDILEEVRRENMTREELEALDRKEKAEAKENLKPEEQE